MIQYAAQVDLVPLEQTNKKMCYAHLFVFYRGDIPYCLYIFLKGAYNHVSHQNQERTQQNV